MSVRRIACIVGARPNFIKMSSVVHEIRARDGFADYLIHTGQHYSPDMSASFFEHLQIPAPAVNLEASGATAIEQTADIMRRLEPVLYSYKPHVVLVVGDVNSTLAAAIVASKLSLPLAHVESGLRSFDRTMPEEVNRVLTDAISDYLFVTEPSGVENLQAEGVPKSKIYLVGNVMIDTLLRFRDQATASRILHELSIDEKSYIVATLHRPSNVDDPERLGALLSVLKGLRSLCRVVFPIHPRTRKRIEQFGLDHEGLTLTPPLGYLDFVKLMSSARLVLTDSGGIQEETTVLGVPCLTLRENTERPVTVEQGTNRLIGVDPERIAGTARETIENPPSAGRIPDLWDGKASGRILDVLEASL